MTFDWRPAQKKAIDAFGGKIVVSAGAGSGKTAVLVARAVEHITARRIDADRLLIITFTNAAADELRSRLGRRLDELVQQQGGEWLRRQALLVRRAHIGTFDSFCRKLCAEHFAELDIPPDFSIETGAMADAMRDQALEQTLETMYADRRFCELADMFGSSRDDRGTEGLVLSLYEQLTRTGDPEAFRARCLGQLSDGLPLDRSVFGCALKARIGRQVDYALSLCRKGCELSLTDEAFEKKCLPVFREMRDRLEEIAAADGLEEKVRRLGRFSAPRLLVPKGDPDTAAALKGLKTAAADIVKTLDKQYSFLSESSYRDDCRRMLPAATVLFEAESLFEQTLFAIKKRRRAYEFTDICRYALSLLVQNGCPTPLAAELSDYYAEVMVDEYQDTDDLQSTLYNAISAEGSKLFLVGDAKQSIYRFRRAEPRIMLRERDAAFPAALAGERPDRFPMDVRLLENFRSDGSVIAAANEIFDVIMTRRTGEIDYPAERMVAHEGAADGGCGLVLSILTGKDEEPERAQARCIARRIRQLMAGDPSLRYEDFAVLSSTVKARGETYEAVFKEEGVPLTADVAETVYTTDEGAVLLSVLAAVDNPLRDIDLSVLLTTPAIGFGGDELLALRAADRRAHLYTNLLRAEGEPMRRACGILQRLLFLKTRLPAEQLAAEAVRLLELETWALSRPGGSYRLDNLNAFVDAARQAAAVTDGSLPRFVRLAERARAGGTADRRSPPPGTVQLKTIHTAKGLEWKYVFLAHAEYSPGRGSNAPLLFDSELGMGVRIRLRSEDGVVRRSTAAYEAISDEMKFKQMSESVRLLYVALTRAKRCTFVLASPKSEKRLAWLYNVTTGNYAREALVAECRSFYEWILLALMANHPRELSGLDFSPVQTFALGAAAVEVTDGAPAPTELPAPPPADPGEAQAIRARLDWVSPERDFSAIPAKISVTALAKQPGDITVAVPAFALAGGLTGAQRGTALHLFMQYADYRLAREDPEGELRRLLDGGYIEPAYAEGVDMKRLRQLLCSDFFAEILASDELLREYEFFLPVPAGELSGRAADNVRTVMLQGIADCVAIRGGRARIIDYKSDAGVTEDILCARYGGQLAWYRRAAERLLGVAVEGCYVWSFTLGRAVSV